MATFFPLVGFKTVSVKGEKNPPAAV